MISYNLVQENNNNFKTISLTKYLRKWRKFLGISKRDMERIVISNSNGLRITKVNCKHQKNLSKRVKK